MVALSGIYDRAEVLGAPPCRSRSSALAAVVGRRVVDSALVSLNLGLMKAADRHVAEASSDSVSSPRVPWVTV